MPPFWVAWWNLLVLPITVGVVEELTYRGYVLPRLIALTNRTLLALLIMAIGFGLQYIALPLVDCHALLSRFIATFLLIPLIIAHWDLDFAGLGLLSLLWALR